MAGQTFTLRATLEVAERLARRLIGNVEGYWPAKESSNTVVNISPGSLVLLGSFDKIIVETDAENDLFFGWTTDVGNTDIEMPINQILVLTGPLNTAYIRNAAPAGTLDAKARLLVVNLQNVTDASRLQLLLDQGITANDFNTFLNSLPTSPVGLSSGEWWNNAGVPTRTP